VLSVVGIGSLIIAIETADTGITAGWLATMGVAIAALGLFFWWQARAPRPLVDLKLARHRTFWVAFVAGAITFGSLIGAMFIGQQFTQNVLGYSTLSAALVVVPSAIFSAIGGQFAGSIINRSGSRASLMLGLISVALAFAVMLVTWREGVAVGWVLLAYGLIGAGVGLAATPASHALMGSVPPARAGMGSGFLDLTRDFGGAVVAQQRIERAGEHQGETVSSGTRGPHRPEVRRNIRRRSRPDACGRRERGVHASSRRPGGGGGERDGQEHRQPHRTRQQRVEDPARA
jgi:hypothetical protein